MFGLCPFANNRSITEDPLTPTIMTRSSGEPIPNYRTVTTVGPRGPPLLEDHVFLEDLQHMGRARIPERVFHAKGSGVHGYFEVTDDITKYCDAKLFCEVGKRTPVFARYSLGLSQLGSADTLPLGFRGLGVKFYTEEGNWDLTLLSDPVLHVNDPIKLASTTPATRPDPQSNLNDPTQVWDFITYTPEMIHFIMWQHMDTGRPDGYRYMDTFAINTVTLINRHGERVYARFQLGSNQGIRNLTGERATQLAGQNPDYASQDLIEAIERGDYPSFTLNVQIMTIKQAEEFEFNPFNVTILWPDNRFPLIRIGRVTFNRNVQNHWDETEQSVFNPGNFIPGIRPSPDKNLAGRILLYRDTQNYRLGVNHDQLPINRPLNPVSNYEREGRGVYVSQGSEPHYFPNSFGRPVESERAKKLDPSFKLCGDIQRKEEEVDYFAQPRVLWKETLDEGHRARVVANLANSLRPVSRPVRERILKLFGKVDEEFAQRVREGIEGN